MLKDIAHIVYGSDDKFAEILGVSPQHYGTLERGVNAFSLENILILCDFYL